MTPRPDLLLVDGSSYLYRAFHALPPLSNSRGEPTGAVHGVLNMLHKLVREYPQARVAVVFDAPGKTFRDELFAEYKAPRPPMPDDLRAQIEPLLAAVGGMGLPLLRIVGVEADDVIGTLAQRAAAIGQQVLISTGDKDMAQLVNERITLINTMSDTLLDRDGVKAKFDVYPEQIIDYLALVGDSSDNIPGVDKVGPKTAAKWLNAYGTLDALLEHAAEIGGKVGENLRAGIDTVTLSRRLATIRCDVDLPVDEAALTPRPPDTAALRELYTRLEMRSFLRQLDGGEASAGAGAAPAGTHSSPAAGAAVPTAPAAPVPGADTLERHYTMITDWTQFLGWRERLESAELFAFDTETTGLDYMQAQIVGVSFCIEPGRGAYIPLAHTYAGAPEQLDRKRVLEALRPLLEDAALAKVGAHMKFDMHVLQNHGISLRGQRYDTMLESYVLDSTATRHDMDSMALRYLGVRTIHFEDVAGKGAKQISFDQVSVESAAEYSAEDADITLRLHRELWPRLAAIPALAKLYMEIEQPLVPVLQRMERGGVLIDRAMLQQQSQELAVRLQELGLEAQRAAGQDFNLESPKQLQQILFEKLQLPVLRKTPTGQPSTAEDVLEELAADYPLPKLILEYRALAKLRSTYTERLPEQIDPTRSIRPPDASTPRITRPWPPRGAFPPRIRTCRTFRSAARRAGASARRSSHRPVTCCWPPITRRSSCASWRTCPAMPGCCAPSRPTSTYTRPRRRKSSASHPKPSRLSSAARPRRSTSG